MMKATQKLYLCIVLLFAAVYCVAQDKPVSPEVNQIYHNANDYMAAGNLKDAIITYKQAILLAPDWFVLYKELGEAEYFFGNYSDAEKTLTPLQNARTADAAVFRLLAASQAAQQERKEAQKTLHKGLAQFPEAGELYYEQGSEYARDGDSVAALNAWLDGIEHAPEYRHNYRAAALTYLNSREALWGLLYGEMYFDMSIMSVTGADSVGDMLLKKKLFEGYKKMFDDIGADNAEIYGQKKNIKPVNSFTDAVMKIYSSLTPVVSDGISTENLVMVRTRFLMDWFATYAGKYPFELFTYQDELVRNGKFEIYNEWLFGKAESELEYTSWNQFHEGDIARFVSWQSLHPLSAVPAQFYNSRETDNLFRKNKH